MDYSFQTVNDPFCSTPIEWVREKIKLLDLKDGETVVDLGCGDARQLIEACKVANVKCIGYEILPEIVQLARKKVSETPYASRIKIKEQNYLEADLSQVDAIILYLSRSVLTELSFLFEKELKPGARVVTHHFNIPGWKEKKIVSYNDRNGTIEDFLLYVKE